MAELRNYKDKNFSVTVNSQKHGIEIRFESKMGNDEIADMKDAGFRWSRRQQMWYAYQNERTIAFANSLIEKARFKEVRRLAGGERMEALLSRTQGTQEMPSAQGIENPFQEITVNELAELIRRRNELDRKIAEIKKVSLDGKTVEFSSQQAKELFIATHVEKSAENTPSPSIGHSENPTESFSDQADRKSIELAIEDLEIAKKFIPSRQYSTMLEYAAHGEEQEFYKNQIRHIAEVGRKLYENRDGKSYNRKTQEHDKGFMHYFIGSSDFYICEVDEADVAFGFTVINGDTGNAEYGYSSLNEITELGSKNMMQVELDTYIDDNISMERTIEEKYPNIFSKGAETEYEETEMPSETVEPYFETDIEVPTETERNLPKDIFAETRQTPSQAKRIRDEARKILSENTDEQIREKSEALELLAQYEGGGGISNEKERSNAEVLNAFYTPREIVRSVWKLADHYAPNAKTVLEPSAGIGRFAENRPDKKFTLREFDETSARIARILHPNASVIQGAFQEQFFDESGRVINKNYEMPKYDLVIGNPPYGENRSGWAGRGEGKEFARLEEYFVSRGLDSLKDENSALAFVMPSSFLKSFPDRSKHLLAEKCVLVDAYRLPNGAFDTTEVGTDIIVLKKGSCRAEDISSDSFFKTHPEKILGEEYTTTDRFGKPTTRVRLPNAMTLRDALDEITGQIAEEEQKLETEKTRCELPANVKEKEAAVFSENRLFELTPYEKAWREEGPRLEINEKLELIENELKDLMLLDPEFESKSKEAEALRQKKEKLNKIFIENERIFKKKVAEHRILRHEKILRLEKVYEEVDTETLKILREENIRLSDEALEKHRNKYEIHDFKRNLDDDIAEFEIRHLAAEAVIHKREPEYLLEVEMRRGSSMQNGKFRIYNFYQKNKSVSDLAKYLKKEFGNYAHGRPYQYDASFSAKGIELTLDRQDLDIFSATQAHYTWNTASNIVKNLIESGEYLTEEELRSPLLQTEQPFVLFDKENGDEEIEGEQPSHEKNNQSEAENALREKIADTLTEKKFGTKWDRKRLSLQYHAADGNYMVSVIFDDDTESLLETLIEEAENFDSEKFADEIISEWSEGHDGEELDEQDEKATRIAEEVEVALESCVPELKSLQRDIYIQKGVKPLAPEEAMVVEKIAAETKMDGWLEIDEDGYIFDLENKVYMDAAELLNDFRDGFEADRRNFESLTEDERQIWNAMVERLSNGVGSQRKNADRPEPAPPPQKEASQPPMQKRKGDTMTSQEFARLYGKEFSESEFKIWMATDWEGRINFSKLGEDEKKELLENSNYAEIEPGTWTHRELFVSGNIRKKIQEYEEKISALGESDFLSLELYKKNIEILKDIMPKNIPMNKLHFGVTTTLAEEFKIKHKGENGKTTKLNLQESFILWAQGETYQSMLANETYYRSGIDFATANISLEEFPENVGWHDIIEYIDKKPVKAVSTRKGYKMTDEEVAEEKAQRKREAEEKRMARAEIADKLFDKFLHEGLSESDRQNVEAEYNSRFNSYKAPDYSKLPLFVDGMSAFKGDDRFRLYDQQIKGISFLSNKGNGLLAYDVGVGKTAAGIVANVNQIQLGRSWRPLIVVPNSVYTKWYNDIKELFPNIQVNDLYNFNKESVKNFCDDKNPHKLNIPENSISLCTYEALTQNITFTDESCENVLYEDFSKLLSEDLDGNATENAKDAEKIKNAIGSASQVKNANFVFFEECGFDNITVDEAHNFKNLWTVPRPKKKGQSNEFSGIPSGKPSQRALKLYAMTQLVQRENDSRNVFLLTATPFTNSPLEVYSILSYIGRQRLIDSGLHSLRDFLNQFAHTKLEIAVNAQGEIDYKQVMKDWNELPALQNILTEYIDKVDGEEAKIIRPRKFTHVKDLDLTPTQKKMIEADAEHMLEVKEGNSAAVIVSMNAMRLALVAPALADKSRYPNVKIPSMEKLVETSPKLQFVCDSIIDMHRTNPEKGQFMYMPLGQQAHGIVKDYLVAHGIPKDAVEIINGSTNNSVGKKEKITKRFNDEKSKLKIIIGGKNTSEGIDLNGNSFVMYNCSLGWNPSEITQAEGRVWRQGNLQGHVHCVYPVMNDSIDSVLYQKHDEKFSRIGDLWSYKGENLNVEDIRPEDLKFDLIKDPMKRAKLILDETTKELKAELSNIELRIKSYDRIVEKRIELKNKLEELNDTLDRHEHLKKQYEESDSLEIPEWLKSEIKVNKLGKKCASEKMEVVNEKLEKMGIQSEEDFAKYVRNLNARKHELENQIKMKESELPAIVAKTRTELNENKNMLPPLEEQRKELCDEILSNLRPMKEVELEIKTERFEKMLERKFQSGEITAEEHDKYSSAGYDNYEKWLCGDIESLEQILDEKRKREETSNEIASASKSKVLDIKKVMLTESSREGISKLKTSAEARMPNSRKSQPSLFEEEYLDSLNTTSKPETKREAKLSEIADSVKEQAREKKNVSNEWQKAHLVVGKIPKSKKRARMER